MPQPIRQQLIAEQAGMIADLLKVNIEDIAFDSNGIKLSYQQMSLLILALADRSHQEVIAKLRAEAESANATREFVRWAGFSAAAIYLEGQA